ncbi:MAG TPA: pyridoxal-phosphate dependent enzyme [Longimicrobiales bacterium]|nr:pyridoxal-phosphate dependent enzyme [Longimicrobiales bacterium]
MPEATAAIPLFERAPALVRSVPYNPIGTYPSPVERVELEDGGERIPILVKRDDTAAEGYAGNKVRKLEFILADARARGITRLITAGATGSHHAFATAYHGRRAGFEVSLVLFPQSLTPHVRQMLLLDAAVGAELLWASRMETVPYGLWRARFAHRREAVCTIPPGGSSDIGTLGYVNGGLELAAQIEAGTSPRPSSVHVAAGTLGTLAGIGIGLAWAGLDIPIVGTRITARLITNERTLAALVNATLARLRSAGAAGLPDAAVVLSHITLQHDQIGAGYGRSTAPGSHAADVFRAAGLQLDTTYTAKAAAGLLAHMRAAAGPGAAAAAAMSSADTGVAARQGGSVPLFWHTLSAVEPHGIADNLTAADLPAQFARYIDGR